MINIGFVSDTEKFFFRTKGYQFMSKNFEVVTEATTLSIEILGINALDTVTEICPGNHKAIIGTMIKLGIIPVKLGRSWLGGDREDLLRQSGIINCEDASE